MIKLHLVYGKVVLALHVIPKASSNKIVGEYNESLKLQLTAPPLKGAANQALIKFLAKKLELNKSQIELISGEKSKDKKVAVSAVTLAELQNKIEQLLRREKK